MNKLKKALCVALVLLLLVASVPAAPVADLGFGITASALNANGSCGDNATYTFDSATGKLVISGTGPMTDYEAVWDDLPSPFYKSEIKSLVVEDGITTIGEDAFYNCDNLTSVVIGDSVTTIGEDAFRDCDNLTSVAIGDSVTTIGEWAFCDCDNLTSVIIPDNVITIDSAAFFSCYNLTSAVIGNGVTTIGDGAFEFCDNLTSVVIGNGVTIIYMDAFGYCNNLTSVTVGNSVKIIYDGAFINCTSLKSINIPKTVTYIGGEAFNYCSSLTDVYYEGTEEDWNAIGTWNNTGLENATIHFLTTKPTVVKTGNCGKTATWTLYDNGKLVIEGTGKINADAFYQNQDIKEVVICDGITEIGADAFYGCSNLTTVDFGNTVTVIGYKAFLDCDSLTSVEIPDSVITVGDYAFYNCNSLTSVTIGDSVTTIGNGAFCDCDNIASIIIPDSVITIGKEAFFKCNNLASVVIGNGVTTIYDYAFFDCYNLTSVTVGSSVESIHYNAFNGCASLESINIPKTVTYIGSEAFRYCPSLTDVYYEGSEEEWNAIDIGEYNTALENAKIHFGSVSEPSTECEHNTGYEMIPYKPATCEKPANIRYYQCKSCKLYFNRVINNQLTDEILPSDKETGKPLGHDFADATCTEPKKCRREGCDKTEGEALGHDWNEFIISTAPTCTTTGIEYSICEREGCNWEANYEIPALGHDYVNGKCTRCGDYEYGCNHIWGVWVITVDATCTMTGIRERTCTCAGCGEIEKEVLAMKDHYFEEKITHATCTEDGYSTFTCTMCGSHYVDKLVKAYGHMFDTYFHDEGSATCYMDGTKTSTCANGCGTKNTVADPGSKTDHEMTDFSVITPATCTEDGEEEAKCFYFDNCGYSEIVPVDALGHDELAEFEIVKEPTCTEKGEKRKVCARCPEIVATEEIPALGHNFINNTCTRCGAVNGNPTPDTGDHTYPDQWSVIIPATCKETGVAVKVCFDCHEVIAMVVPKAGHSDFDGDSKCDTCGGTITVVEPEKPAEKPEEKPCNCDCHAGGIKAFFFKLINFFAKIFDKNARVCDCGKAH